MIKNTRILFFGTPYFAAESLNKLIENGFNIVGLVCQPDKKSGRGQKVIQPETKVLAERHNIKVFQPESKNELIGIMEETLPELAIVAAYGKMIPEDVLNYPKYSTLNIHGSMLPSYRGSSCIPEAIISGDAKTGISIMKLVYEMDAGPVISSVEVPIENDDTTLSLTKKMATAGAEEIIRIVPLWINGQVMAKEQIHEKATYCKMIQKEDGKIKWDEPAIEIERKIRAYIPWPNAYTYLNGKSIKILAAGIVDESINAGQIVVRDKNLLVGTGKKSLMIIELQPEGKNKMTAKDFLNGHPEINNSYFDRT